MPYQDLKAEAENLEARLGKADSKGRLEIQAELAELIMRMQATGEPVPARLRHLDAVLTEEAIEARFDNLPV